MMHKLAASFLCSGQIKDFVIFVMVECMIAKDHLVHLSLTLQTVTSTRLQLQPEPTSDFEVRPYIGVHKI